MHTNPFANVVFRSRKGANGLALACMIITACEDLQESLTLFDILFLCSLTLALWTGLFLFDPCIVINNLIIPLIRIWNILAIYVFQPFLLLYLDLLVNIINLTGLA